MLVVWSKQRDENETIRRGIEERLSYIENLKRYSMIMYTCMCIDDNISNSIERKKLPVPSSEWFSSRRVEELSTACTVDAAIDSDATWESRLAAA